jgi:hypothetical protein
MSTWKLTGKQARENLTVDTLEKMFFDTNEFEDVYEKINFLNTLQNSLNILRGRFTNQISSSLQIGRIVQWQGNNNEHVLGIIKKVNPKTLKIEQIAIDSYPEMKWAKDNESEKMFPQTWKVSPNLVRPIPVDYLEEVKQSNQTRCINGCCSQ